MKIYAIITPDKNCLTKNEILYLQSKEIYDECFMLTQEQINSLRLDTFLPEDYYVVINNGIPSFLLSLKNQKILKTKTLNAIYQEAQRFYITQNNILFVYPLMGEHYKVDWIKQVNQARFDGKATFILESISKTENGQIIPFEVEYTGEWKDIIFKKINKFVDNPISIYNLKLKQKIKQNIKKAENQEQLDAVNLTGFKNGFAENTIDLGNLCEEILKDETVSQEDKNWVLTKYDQQTKVCNLVELL